MGTVEGRILFWLCMMFACVYISGELMCPYCDGVTDEAECMVNKTCPAEVRGRTYACWTQIRSAGTKLIYWKDCKLQSSCWHLDEIYCNRVSCFKCCTDGDLCNTDTADVLAELTD